jgi:two-component system cell cycle sensor histidine kinase/response regulator CckA
MSAPSEADLRRIFDRSPIGIYRSTADGRFLYVNPALVAMLGYDSADELIAVDITTTVYAIPAERRPLVDRYLTAGLVDGVDVTWRRRDGRFIQVRLYGHAVAENGDSGFDVQVVDVTALRAAEAKVREQRTATEQALAKLRSVMAQMPVMVWTTDRDLRFTSIEGTAYPGTDALIGTPLPNMLAGKDLQRGLDAHRRALEDGTGQTFEGEYDDKCWLITVAPMRDADGAIVGVIGSGIDVTMVRRLERNVQQTQRIESLGVLAGGVAHDFNNLLVAMLGNADRALRVGIAEPDARHAVEAVRTAALRASELTSQLLAYSGRGQLAVTCVEVAPLVAEMVALLAPGRSGSLRLDLSPELPSVRADAAQVRQVVMNLITNAFDAIRDVGEVHVRTRLVEVTADPHPMDVVTPPAGAYVAIEVGDDGVGMDMSTRRKIFDPFYTTKPSGHGLGLAAVLGIVRGHRGGLRVYTQPGIGSTFEVLLPVDGGAAVDEAVVARAPRVQHDKTVMVVDDEEMVREVLCHMIEDLGYRAIGAAGGHEALELAGDRATKLDAAIVDLTMPRLNGSDVAAGLRACRPALPVILTSGYDRDRVAAADAAGFLRKPFRFETLEVLLAEILGVP